MLRVPILALMALAASACASAPAPPLEPLVYCAGRWPEKCPVDKVLQTSIIDLRNAGNPLTVQCPDQWDETIDEDDRRTCRTRVEAVARALAEKWGTELGAIPLEKIEYFDKDGSCVTFVTGYCVCLVNVSARLHFVKAR